MTETDFLLALMQENRQLDQNAEQRRMAIAHLNIIIVLVYMAVSAVVGFDRSDLSLLMILTGIYGYVATLKLYERSQYHITRARKIRARLDELLPEAKIDEVLNVAEDEHREQYSRMMNVRLNQIWLGVHVGVMVFGVICMISCLI